MRTSRAKRSLICFHAFCMYIECRSFFSTKVLLFICCISSHHGKCMHGGGGGGGWRGKGYADDLSALCLTEFVIPHDLSILYMSTNKSSIVRNLVFELMISTQYFTSNFWSILRPLSGDWQPRLWVSDFLDTWLQEQGPIQVTQSVWPDLNLCKQFSCF